MTLNRNGPPSIPFPVTPFAVTVNGAFVSTGALPVRGDRALSFERSTTAAGALGAGFEGLVWVF